MFSICFSILTLTDFAEFYLNFSIHLRTFHSFFFSFFVSKVKQTTCEIFSVCQNVALCYPGALYVDLSYDWCGYTDEYFVITLCAIVAARTSIHVPSKTNRCRTKSKWISLELKPRQKSPCTNENFSSVASLRICALCHFPAGKHNSLLFDSQRRN